MAASSYPPKPCKHCGRGDGNWIVAALGCNHCFDPFATAAQLALLQRVAEIADEVVHSRQSIEQLGKIVEEWKENGAAFPRHRSIVP
jgi:hypothetical protein